MAGYANTGKSSLMKKLIKVFKKRVFGWQLSNMPPTDMIWMLKRDTWQFCQAGADRVVIVGPRSLTMHHLYEQEPSFDEVCEMIQDVDLILVEGYKSEQCPKVEVVRKGIDERPDLGDELIAVVSDDHIEERVPCFSTESVEQLAEFLIDNLSLRK
ncbi:MAG: molybdopterin-guanine dinucleotide biosynthesis protein B [Thermoanaerobacterales bacterium]|nr:molybdopterin-guanine dinucleotide biosynthesis protein B [Thermoanaerobacterales bacterium]